MATKRQDILTRVQEIIRSVTINGETVFEEYSVKLDKNPPTDLATASFPQCFIYSGSETRFLDERAVIGKERWEWIVVLEIWGNDSVLEDILNAVHAAMFADNKFDNVADYSERIGVDFQTVDPTMQLESMVLPYRVIYKHAQGDMET